MSQQLPSNLRLLLETPLEEELYMDWCGLLETLIIDYMPSPYHLNLCMTLVVHPRFEDHYPLQASCYRVLLRTFANYGSRAFRGTLEIRSARHKRRKMRHSTLDAEGETIDTEEFTGVPLATTDSVFAQFSNIWDLFSCGLSQDEHRAYLWTRLIKLLCDILEEDWNSAVTDKLDLSKTLVVKLLRFEDDKHIDLKKIVRTIFSRSTDPTSWTADPYRDNERPTQKETWQSSHKNSLGTCESIPIRQKLIVLLYNVSKSHKLSVIDEGDLTTTVAGVIATIPIRAMLDIFQIRQCGQQDDYLHAIKEICNALLFRLAAFPEKIGSKDKKVNWTRVQGWCTAESRSSDVLEASTVEYLKCNIFLAYVQLHRTDVPREDINEAARCLLAGFEKLIDHTLSDESSRTDDAKDSYKALVSDPDGLESIVANCEKVVRSIMF